MDIEVEDLFEDDGKKKKIKSGKKGKRVENELCKVLNDRFLPLFQKHPDWGRFSRTMGSGNRWGQHVHLSKAAKDTLSADLTCPDNFVWVIESKGGYNDIDVFNAISGNHSEIDEFIEQVTADAGRTGKKPMLVWKKDRKRRSVWIRTVDLPKDHCKFKYMLTYGEWTGFSFDELLKFDDSFFFNLT